MTVTGLADLDKVAARIGFYKAPGGDAGSSGLARDWWTDSTDTGVAATSTQRRPGSSSPGSIIDPGRLRAPTGALENYLRAVRGLRCALGTNVTGGDSGGSVVLYDRLYDKGAFVGNITTVQNVDNTALLPVNRGPGFDGIPGDAGEDCEIALIERTAVGANAATVVATYVNELGTAGRTTPSVLLDLNRNANKITFLPLASGDRGVRSVTSIQITTATAAAGSFEVVIMRRLASLPLIPDAVDATDLDWLDLALPLIYPRMCLTSFGVESSARAANEQPAGILEIIEA